MGREGGASVRKTDWRWKEYDVLVPTQTGAFFNPKASSPRRPQKMTQPSDNSWNFLIVGFPKKKKKKESSGERFFYCSFLNRSIGRFVIGKSRPGAEIFRFIYGEICAATEEASSGGD